MTLSDTVVPPNTRHDEKGPILRRILAVRPHISSPVRDLLANLDLWADVSASFGAHVRDGLHDDGPRYGFDLEHDTRGDGPDGYVLGPVCAGCIATAGELVAAWTAHYAHLNAVAECASWATVAASARRANGCRR